MNDRLLKINWVAGKPTPTIGSKRCSPVVRIPIINARKGREAAIGANGTGY
ncbi:hypothetical protein [Polaromonas jejuensis]|uniref:Uncharacterized protein n=1 Tax=Polaromonas jejuensis TaxID=457502 RepID=A0ABW0QFJ6_9BURK|nr:hypothetical protein [Polaromonas jejuensis]